MRESDLFDPEKQLLLNKFGCGNVYVKVLKYDVVSTIGNREKYKSIAVDELGRGMDFKVANPSKGVYDFD